MRNQLTCQVKIAMIKEKLLDVSNLEPPLPLERALNESASMVEGEYLRLLIDKEPFLLYPILKSQGYMCETRVGTHNQFEVLIWRKNDQQVAKFLHPNKL